LSGLLRAAASTGQKTGAPHIYKHGVSESEVEEVLASAGEDRAGCDAQVWRLVALYLAGS
jgi:hypothetical protein